MPVPLFCDSWDHYNTVDQKWDFTGNDNQIDLTGTKGRTGIGCLLILSAAFGPRKNIPQTTTPVVGTAFYSNTSTSGDVIRFNYAAAAIQNVRIRVQGDGTIQALTGNDGGVQVIVLGTSAPCFQFNTYNYIEAQTKIANAPNGSVVVRCNGVEVLNIQGVSTVTDNLGSPVPFVTQIQLMGPGGIADLRHDDTYIADWGTTPGTPFYGALRFYCIVPTADRSPLQWTPNAGLTHYTQVDEIPPDDNTTYNSDGTTGHQDQYEYDSVDIPANAAIAFIQHSMDAELDSAGSLQIESAVNGLPSGLSFPLTLAYKIYTTPYATNPGTGIDWLIANFPANFGPQTV